MKHLIFFLILIICAEIVIATPGDVWVIDFQKGNAYLLNQQGTLLKENGHLTFPDLIKSTSDGGAWVLDKGAERVVRLNENAEIVSSILVAEGATDFAPYGTDVLVTDSSRGLIIQYDLEGKRIKEWNRFRIPTLVEVDKISGFWVGDSNEITKIDSSGEKQFSVPFPDVDVISPTDDGGSWIADEKARTHSKVEYNGSISVTVTRYRRVSDLTPLPDGGVFLIDKDNRKVVLIDKSGNEVHFLSSLDLDNPKYISYDRLSQSLWVTSGNSLLNFDKSGKKRIVIDWIPYPADISIVEAGSLVIPKTSNKEEIPSQSWRKQPSVKEESEPVIENGVNIEKEEILEVAELVNKTKEIKEEKVLLESKSVWKDIPELWIGVGSLCVILLILFIILMVQRKWK